LSEQAIDAEIVEESAGELAVREPHAPLTLFGTEDPVLVIEKASRVASALMEPVEKQRLYAQISGSKYPKLEAWTLLGSMLGVFPIVIWTRKVSDPEGWEARVEARTRSGELVGAAEAECLRSESKWRNRDDYALRSMAQTRASSKALRVPLGFVMVLAGFDATPAEERGAETPEPSRGDDGGSGDQQAQASSADDATRSGDAGPAPKMITQAQHKKIGVLLKLLEEKAPTREGQLTWVAELREHAKVQSRKDMTREQAGEAIDWLEKTLADLDIPF